jgi:hypothetical protein
MRLRGLTEILNRNIGILCAFLAFFFPAYVLAAELAKPPKTRGEILVFRRGKGFPRREQPLDTENQEKSRPVVAEKMQSLPKSDMIAAGKDVFHWEDLCYDIKVKGGTRRLLDHVDGWVKPGVSTILMVSTNPYPSTHIELNVTVPRVYLAQVKRLS